MASLDWRALIYVPGGEFRLCETFFTAVPASRLLLSISRYHNGLRLVDRAGDWKGKC
jgi:hypothetical protein